jgi:hypothetical protein
MEPENLSPTNSVGYILLGALIAFVSANVVEYIKSYRERNEKTKNFKLFIKLELAVIAKTLEKLQAGLTYGSFYDFSLLDRIKESVENLGKVRTEVIYLSDAELKEKFIDALSDISGYITAVRAYQELFYQDQRSVLPNKVNKVSKNKSKKSVSQKPSNIRSMEDVWDKFNRTTTQKTIEYVEIKRQLEDLIKSLR